MSKKAGGDFHRTMLWVGGVIGVFAAATAGIFAVAGAGMFGSPFQGDPYYNTTLLLVLVLGPFAILPCVVLETWRPRVGALALCGFAIAATTVIILNNIRMWGFAIHDASLATFCISTPMFVVGSLLYFSAEHRIRALTWIWTLGLIAFAATAAYLFTFTGGDGIDAAMGVLFRGEQI